MSKRLIHRDVPICCTRALKNCNFLESLGNFLRDQGIRDVWLSNSVFLELFKLYDRNLHSIAFSRPTAIAFFFFKTLCFYETESIFVRFSSLSHHFFSQCLYISRFVTHGVRKVLLKFHYTPAF